MATETLLPINGVFNRDDGSLIGIATDDVVYPLLSPTHVTQTRAMVLGGGLKMTPRPVIATASTTPLPSALLLAVVR